MVSRLEYVFITAKPNNDYLVLNHKLLPGVFGLLRVSERPTILVNRAGHLPGFRIRLRTNWQDLQGDSARQFQSLEDSNL